MFKKISLLLFLYLFVFISYAHADVVGAIWTVITWIVDWIWTYPVMAALTAVSIGVALTAKDKAVKGSRYATSEIDNVVSNEDIVPIVYGGPILLGGNIVWQSNPGTTVYRFLAMCIGEIESITNIIVDNQDIAGLDGCSYTAYTGTSTQIVDSRGSSVVKGLHDVAYLALTLTKSDKVSSNPIVAGRVSGRKVSTWDGAVWTTAKTFSKNPAAIIRDYMLLSRVLGGCGLSSDYIDDASFGSFYAYCAEPIDNGAGGTEARYELCILIDTKHSMLDNLQRMLLTCNAQLIRSAAAYKIVYEKAGQTAVQAFTENNIVKGSFKYGYGRTDEMPNAVGVEWISAFEAKNPKRIAWAEDELDRETRGRYEQKVEAYGIIRQSQASRLAKKALYEIKLNDIWCEFESNMEAMHCEPYDVVSVTHSRPEWTAALFIVIEINEVSFGRAKYICMAYNSSVLDDRHGSTFDDWDYGSPPNPYEPVTDVSQIVLTEVGWRNADGTHIAHIDVSWTAPATKKELLDFYIIELQKGTDDYISVGSAPASATENRINLNLEINVTYTVRIKTKSIEGIISNGTVSPAIHLVGKDAPPSDVSSFIVRKFRDFIICKWVKVSDIDVAKYEIRKGTTWSVGGIIATPVYGNELTIRDIRLGTDQSYWIKAIDNSGNYSINATEALITVDNIPFQNIIETYEEHPGWTGDKSQTEISGNNLIISDTYLTGTYTTSIKDIGYICDVRVMITSIASINENLAWDSDPARKFNDSPTLRFVGEETPGAASYEIRTSEDNVDWTSWEEWITADYLCRYFQIRMTVVRESVETSLIVSNLTITTDLPDVDEKGIGEVTDAGAGAEITFTETYHEPPSVNIDILTGDAYVHKFSTAPTITGFVVKLYELDGTAVIGDFSYHAHGI